MIAGSPLAILSLLMGGVVQTIMLALTAVIASYAFMALGARVKRHATAD
jgi:ABC-type proline/glycine betaine transport system permease subunit